MDVATLIRQGWVRNAYQESKPDGGLAFCLRGALGHVADPNVRSAWYIDRACKQNDVLALAWDTLDAILVDNNYYGLIGWNDDLVDHAGAIALAEVLDHMIHGERYPGGVYTSSAENQRLLSAGPQPVALLPREVEYVHVR